MRVNTLRTPALHSRLDLHASFEGPHQRVLVVESVSHFAHAHVCSQNRFAPQDPSLSSFLIIADAAALFMAPRPSTRPRDAVDAALANSGVILRLREASQWGGSRVFCVRDGKGRGSYEQVKNWGRLMTSGGRAHGARRRRRRRRDAPPRLGRLVLREAEGRAVVDVPIEISQVVERVVADHRRQTVRRRRVRVAARHVDRC